ncbi:MAG TPA: hypothetical protein EYN51_08740 [Flavobacteriales bacterium]|nr:hypothetical protein [Flavobacteriales bacterium]
MVGNQIIDIVTIKEAEFWSTLRPKNQDDYCRLLLGEMDNLDFWAVSLQQEFRMMLIRDLETPMYDRLGRFFDVDVSTDSDVYGIKALEFEANNQTIMITVDNRSDENPRIDVEILNIAERTLHGREGSEKY